MHGGANPGTAARGKATHRFFNDEGICCSAAVPGHALHGESQHRFLRFLIAQPRRRFAQHRYPRPRNV
jgi:hypothetical protein